MAELRVGVVGLRFGRTWMNGFRHHPRCRLACVCDIDVAILEQAAAESRPDIVTNKFEDVVDDPRIDAVAVITPAPVHAEQAVVLLRAGKHVLSAVPAALTVKGCREIVVAARESGRVYMMAENWPYEPSLQRAQQLYCSGKLGSLYYGEAEYLHHLESLWFKPGGEPTWRMSLSPLLYPTHGIGPYLYMTGDRFAEVTAYSVSGNKAPKTEPKAAWLAVAMLRSEQGCLFKLLNSFCNAHPGGHYLSFYGDRGSFETARGKNSRTIAKYWLLGDEPRAMTREQCTYPPAPDYVQNMGAHAGTAIRIIDDLVGALFDDAPIPIGPRLAVDMTLPGICAVESLSTGRTVPIPDPREW